MDYKVKNNIAASLISIYGVAISIVTIFTLAWDNKGAKSMWDKSTNDWLFTIWLMITTTIVWLSVANCLSDKQSKNIYLKALSFILVLHSLFVLSEASYEAMLYLGLPHIALALGIVIWWRNKQALKMYIGTRGPDK